MLYLLEYYIFYIAFQFELLIDFSFVLFYVDFFLKYTKAFQKSLNYFTKTKFKAETFHCEVTGIWPECNHMEKENDTYVQQIKSDETRMSSF